MNLYFLLFPEHARAGAWWGGIGPSRPWVGTLRGAAFVVLMVWTAAGLRAADRAPAGPTTSVASVERLIGTPSAVWADGARELELVVRNRTDRSLVLPVTVQLLQASSATTAAWSAPATWRTVTLAPGQASLERVTVPFPALREPASFLVRFAREREVLGVVPVRVYPDTILRELTNDLGSVIVDGLPAETMSVLSGAGWTLVQAGQLSESGRSPRLAFLGVGSPADQARARAQAGLGVIWLQADSEEPRRAIDVHASAQIDPSYYPVRVGKSMMVVARSEILSGLAGDPDAQRRLARMVRLALGQETLGVPPAADGRLDDLRWKE